MPTISNVPTTALPKPPPVIPAAGGSSVNTLQLNSGNPFFRTRKTIENRGTSVRSARPTQIPLKNLLQRERTPTRALLADEKKSVGFAAVAVLAMIVPLLAYSCSSPLRVAQNDFSGHVDEQSQDDQQKSRVHQ